MIPVFIIMEELHAFRVAFHTVDKAFEQFMFISPRVQFPVFLRELITEFIQYRLGFARSVPLV